MIKLNNLKFNKDNIEILNDLSIDIYDNSVTCIVGNKGSGKSSILKILSGVYRNYSGQITYNDKDIDYCKDLKIDVLLDSREKDEDITVSGYLNFYGNIYNTYSSAELTNYIDMMLAKFSLLSYKYTSINMLDSENYKLLELIRISINDPDVILFDNLFSSDDISFNEKLLEYIKTLIGKKTLVFTSRNLNILEEIATHIVIIDGGKVIAMGKKEDVYKKAFLNNKINLQVLEGEQEAVDILKGIDEISNITYDDNIISFSLSSDISYSTDRNKVEADILKKLVDNGAIIYSYQKQQVKFEHLFEKLKG